MDLYGAEMKKLNKLRKKQRASLQVLGLKGQTSVVKKRRPFSAPRHRNSNITHFASTSSLKSIPGTNTIPDLSSYTTPAKRKTIGPIYPSRYGVDEELSHRLNMSMKREIEAMVSDQYNKLKASHPTFSPKQRIDERERQNLAGMKNTKLKYRSNGVDVAVALSEAATLCLQRPPGEDNQTIGQGPNARWWPNTRRVALCVATIEKLCRHPRLSVEEHKQLEIVVDTVKSGLYSNRYFGPPPKETVLNKPNSTEPIDMEPKFYFDLCKHLESTNDHLVSTSETLKANLEKEREQVQIYKQLLKESQEKVASLRGELEDHDKRNLILNKRVVYMQDSASDALDEYNKLNAMYVDLDGRFSVTASKANKLDKELAGLHKMYVYINPCLEYLYAYPTSNKLSFFLFNGH